MCRPMTSGVKSLTVSHFFFAHPPSITFWQPNSFFTIFVLGRDVFVLFKSDQIGEYPFEKSIPMEIFDSFRCTESKDYGVS